MADIFNIAGEINSTSQEGTAVHANQVKDDLKNKKQSQINEEVGEELELHTNRLNALTGQNYITVQATQSTTAADIPTLINASGEGEQTNTLYRVGFWDGSAYVADKYTEYAWNGTAYVILDVKSSIGEVFDISAYHATGGELATYADLAAALDSNNGGGVPQSLQRGGMSVKFVQSSDNKYVQYFLTKNTWSANKVDWEKMNLEEEVSQLEDAKFNNDDLRFTEIVNVNLSGEYDLEYTNNAVSSSTGKQTDSSDKRASTPKLYYVIYGNRLTLTKTDGYGVTIYCFDINKSLLGYTSNIDTLIAGTAFIRLLVVKSDNSTITPTEAKNNVTITSYANTEVTDALSQRITAVDDVVKGKLVKISPNMLNPASMMEETAITTTQVGGTVTTGGNASYKTILGIPVKQGVSYNIGNSHRVAIIYDGDDVIRQVQGTNQTSIYAITPIIDGYLGISFYSTESVTWVGKSSEMTQYLPYGAYIAQEWLDNFVEFKIDGGVLTGKSIYNFGDSVSHGEGNVVDGVPTGPALLLAQDVGMTCIDYAISGASVCDDTEHGRSWIYDQIVGASSTAPDFVLLAGGINDLRFTIPGDAPISGTGDRFNANYINAVDKTKVSGGLEYLIYTILNKWPTTQIVYMYEHKMAGHYFEVDTELHDVIVSVCKKWDVPILDMYENGGLNLCTNSQIKLYGSTTTATPTVQIDGVWYDATHCNGDGYQKFYIPKLKSLLMSLIP